MKTKTFLKIGLLLTSLSFSLVSCGVLFCQEKAGSLYSMHISIVDNKGTPIKGALFYTGAHGRSVVRSDGTLSGGPIIPDSSGGIIFEENEENYTSCESAPGFASIAPVSILAAHPLYDTLRVTLSQSDLKRAVLTNGVYELGSIVMNVK